MFSYASLGLVLLPFVSATVHDIQVGASGLTFDPPAIGAVVGDQVVFHFHAKNHSVVQSSFASPCGPMDGGVNTGFHPVPANQTDNLPTFTFTVNDTKPFWAYCSQAANTAASHCGAGMVFAVNCGPDGAPNSFTNFKQSALDIGKALSASASSAPSQTTGAPASDAATAAYGGYTIAPAPQASLLTQTVTLESSTWTTTYSSFPNSPAATPAALAGQVIKVIVGGPGNLTFNPPRVSASPRDTIVFEFHQKNHTVTQSSFADPCRKLNVNGTTGFDSDFQPVATDATSFPTWNYTVADTAPVWAYCRQQTPSSHCGAGMVFAINSDESSPRSFSAFQTLAEKMNGTASASGSTPSATGSNNNGAASLTIGSATFSVAFAALVALLL